MQLEIGKFWMGTEEALGQYLLNFAMALKHGYAPQQGPTTEDTSSRLVSVSNGVAVISIRGALTNRDSGYRAYETTYPEIRNALIQVAADPAVKGVLLDMNSGGGAVTGVSDTAKLIRTVDGIKPVYAYSDGMAASAAYWLASSARAVYSSEMAELGSVGVITTHMSMQRLYQEAGIDPTVIRAGEFKALGHSMEALSPKAKAVIQGQLDQMYGMFAGYVADRRGMTLDNFNKTAGEGRVFIGQSAVEAGLSDGVTSFDKLISKIEMDTQQPAPVRGIRAEGSRTPVARATAAVAAHISGVGGIAISENLLQSGLNQPQGHAVKTALTDAQVAALAEGASLQAGELAPEAAATDSAAPEATALEAAAPEASQTPVAAAAAAAAPAAPEASQTSVVSLLQAQLADAQTKLIGLSVQLKGAQAELAGAKLVATSFRSVAQASVDRMKVAMGMPAGVAAANDEALMAEHATLRAAFEAKFKSGGVAAVSTAAASKEGAGSQPDSARLARIQATRLI